MDDLVKRLRDVVPYQGKSATAFLCHEAAAALEAKDAELARLRDETEKWKKAFAAQSNKLQNVLHIPGVRAALQAKE